ncbi:hypothetical protein Dsin_032222 [Dipteronia sinensis]|uniref:Ubiquitin-like protease family profile domain-containing protein n=1 Tax=Dipteronia sinensis TaxID=43782 RepID=A0AAE0DSV3_9ROSI|nr:hypothetical protein Dsin_032222 [Dipteronia sinensis]
MFRQDFKEIADKNEWMSNLVQLKKVWSLEMEKIQIQRDVKEIERTALKTENEAIHGQPKGRKKILPTPKGLEVWDEYPEFLPLEFEPEEHFCTYVRGDDSLYNVPWWTMESVLIPCNTSGHWVLCQVLLKEGKVNLFDSMWGRNNKNDRLREISCLLYLLPSILHRAGYYEELGIKPRNKAFLAENVNKIHIPQQEDGKSCGAFMLKFAELLLSGTSLPWINKFGQNDIPAIREAMALDLFINGVIER